MIMININFIYSLILGGFVGDLMERMDDGLE
jgi:hypothetical protein